VLFRALDRRSGAPARPARPAPEQLLAERFARGEIGEEEYRRRCPTLTGTGQARTPSLTGGVLRPYSPAPSRVRSNNARSPSGPLRRQRPRPATGTDRPAW